MSVQHVGDHRVDRGGCRDVGGVGAGFPAELFDLFGDGRKHIGGPAGDRDVGARFGQSDGECPAEAAAPTGDQRDSAGEVKQSRSSRHRVSPPHAFM